MTESTYKLTGAAVVPTDQIVLPTRTMVAHVENNERPLWNEDEIVAQRPSDKHYIAWAAVWVPGDVFDAS